MAQASRGRVRERGRGAGEVSRAGWVVDVGFVDARRVTARGRGFSIVELVIVVSILGIIATIAVRRVGDMGQKARVATLQATVRNVSSVIQEYHGVHGEYPPAIRAGWFTTGRLPANPYFLGEPTVEVVNEPGVTEPTAKRLGGGRDPYWYNTANGFFRARVAPTMNAEVFATVNLSGSRSGLSAGTGPGGGLSVGGGG